MGAYNIAIVGVTGVVGQTILDVLSKQKFPVDQLFPLASSRSAGKKVHYNAKEYIVQDVKDFDFSQADIALFSAGGSVSKEFAPKAAKQGCIVIDNTSEFRYDDDVPLIIPEVNADQIANYKVKNIIANPNCSTIQMLLPLAPIHFAVGIDRINVATYQSVSGAGMKAIQECETQSQDVLNKQSPQSEVFSQQIAFNVIPQIDKFQENGYTREEMKMVWESKKILGDQEIKVNPTAVRVPVMRGHSEAVHIETKKKISRAEVIALLDKAPGIVLMDDPSNELYPTAAVHAAFHDEVFVGRVREDISHPKGIDLWIVSDNLLKGAATNAVQIAKLLIEEYISPRSICEES